MKKLFLILSLFTCSVFAGQTVPIVWPFSPASNQATVLRTIIENANSSQNKYTFVFEHKPGAGGSIAVNHVINQNKPTLLMISTSVFIRPIYYPNESYDVNKLQPVLIPSNNSPMVLLSKKFDSIDSMKRAEKITIGIVNGSITEMVARKIVDNAKLTNVIFVPYPGSIDATRDVMGGHIDASIEFLKDATPWVESGSAHIVGVTGTKSNYKTFQSQNVRGLENIVVNYHVVTNTSMDSTTINEMYDILRNSMLKQNVIDLWKNDGAQVVDRTYPETIKFWNIQKDFWK